MYWKSIWLEYFIFWRWIANLLDKCKTFFRFENIPLYICFSKKIPILKRDWKYFKDSVLLFRITFFILLSRKKNCFTSFVVQVFFFLNFTIKLKIFSSLEGKILTLNRKVRIFDSEKFFQLIIHALGLQTE